MTEDERAVRVDVVIEVPRGSFLKRGSTGRVDFVSLFPCPFNYGSIPSHIGLDGDLLDAVVLGRRLPRGTRLSIPARFAVGLYDRDMVDDKLVCAERSPSVWDRRRVVLFFHCYALFKKLLNFWRGRPGRTAVAWTCAPARAIERARLRDKHWSGPTVPY